MSKKRTREPVVIPPLVAALARLTEQNCDTLNTKFIAAYAAAPELAKRLIEGNEDACYALMEQVSGLAKASAAVEQRGVAATLATIHKRENGGVERAIAVLEQYDPDLLAELTTPVADGAFQVGFALAAFLLTERK